MVERKKPMPIVLTPEMKKQLTDGVADDAQSREFIEIMREFGMDVTSLEGLVERTEKTRKLLLKHFG